MYVKCAYKSKALMRATEFHMFLPFYDGYPAPKAPYRTLYFLPGYSGNAEELAFCLPMRQMSARHRIAVVIPDGENSFYMDHPERAALHGDFAGRELVEVTRQMYPCLSSRREDTFIGGISMGGYGAAILGLRFYETFSRILLMSPAIEPDTLLTMADPSQEGAVPPQLFESALGGRSAYEHSWRDPAYCVQNAVASGRGVQPMHMCCGEQDALVGGACGRFRGLMEELGLPLTFEGGAGGHDLEYWDAHLDSCFSFLDEEAGEVK